MEDIITSIGAVIIALAIVGAMIYFLLGYGIKQAQLDKTKSELIIKKLKKEIALLEKQEVQDGKNIHSEDEK